MIKKCAFLALAAMMSAGAMAQKTSEYELPDVYGLGNESVVKKNNFAVDLGLGNSFGLGLRLQHNFNKNISWDVLGFRYGYDYGNDEYGKNFKEYGEDYYHEIVLSTGVRAFTNTLQNGKTKFYANFDIGYGWVQVEDYHSGYYYDYSYTEGYHHLAMGVGLGVYLNKHIYIGYDLQGYVVDGHCDHTARLGFQF